MDCTALRAVHAERRKVLINTLAEVAYVHPPAVLRDRLRLIWEI
jgi:hypothetical protein